MNNLPVLSYQNSVNPPVDLGIPAYHFDRMHYLIRSWESFETPGTWNVMRSYVPIGSVVKTEDGYAAVRYGSYTYPTFGEAVADLMVRTS